METISRLLLLPSLLLNASLLLLLFDSRSRIVVLGDGDIVVSLLLVEVSLVGMDCSDADNNVDGDDDEEGDDAGIDALDFLSNRA